jgi:hypothetical protein
MTSDTDAAAMLGRLDEEERQSLTSLAEELLNDNPLAVAFVNVLREISWAADKPKPPTANGQGPIPATKPPGRPVPGPPPPP